MFQEANQLRSIGVSAKQHSQHIADRKLLVEIKWGRIPKELVDIVECSHNCSSNPVDNTTLAVFLAKIQPDDPENLKHLAPPAAVTVA
jgi:hypothetical protein